MGPAAPPVAAAVFGQALERAVAYAELLAGPGVERGLLGPHEADRIWERHLLNCAPLAALLPAGSALDLGSGAGLPGVVLALLRPDCTFVLVDATRRRTEFLAEVIDRLGLPGVTVRWARAEELAGAVLVDAVVARAVAPLDRLARWSMPLLRPGGELLAIKGETADEEAASAAAAVLAAGGTDIRVVRCSSGVVDLATTVVRVRRQDAGRTGRRKEGRRGR
ncbi:MAG: 16S rRNA (guanine(527)-N(7))-methyltransferase RsmG [Frankiaceae bacterium]